MNIFELEKKAAMTIDGRKMVKDVYDDLYDLYDKSFKVVDLPADELLAIVRSFDEKMVRKDEESGIKYLDKSLRKMTLEVAFFTQCTDLDMKREGNEDGENSTKSPMIAAYDAIQRLRLDSYMYDRDFAVYHIFNNFVYLEEEMFFDRNRGRV